jgi:ribosomal protein L16 Arg81 hydroxylase
MEQIKEAFSKVKQDMDLLKSEMAHLKESLKETRESLIELCELFKQFSSKKDSQANSKSPTENPTHQQINQTHPANNPTHPTHFKPLKDENLPISTGNDGVPTNKQTDKQTNQQTDKGSYNSENKSKENPILDAVKILDSLDNLKKEIRLKFKRLTDQEMAVFSALHQLQEEEGHADYRGLSQKLKLTESSIRDYVGRLIKKGIPVEKIKINNKNIQLIISPNLKKVASLSTIMQLRDL